MFAVTVLFRLHEGKLSSFEPLMEENARRSLADEPGCRRFDVCSDTARPSEIFLYELYDDEAAFQAHLKTPHFLNFDDQIAGMVADKTILTFDKVVS